VVDCGEAHVMMCLLYDILTSDSCHTLSQFSPPTLCEHGPLRGNDNLIAQFPGTKACSRYGIPLYYSTVLLPVMVDQTSVFLGFACVSGLPSSGCHDTRNTGCGRIGLRLSMVPMKGTRGSRQYWNKAFLY
jgi:hypothetical protein